MSEENILSVFTGFISKSANYNAGKPDDLPGKQGPRVSPQFGVLNNPNTAAASQAGATPTPQLAAPLTKPNTPLKTINFKTVK